MNAIGIYEKALPKELGWQERMALVKDLGFSFIELSIDESDERLARLDWTIAEREEVLDALHRTGTRIHTLMLSGLRRYPLGSVDEKIQQKALELVEKSLDLAAYLGARNIQLAGYDVFYDKKSVLTREYFMENLKRAVEMAARKGIILSIETMDDDFINSLSKIRAIKSQIKSPWLQAYPDLGNLTAWSDNNIGRELELGIENIVGVHLKDTKPVTPDFQGQFRDVPFGEGTVDFEGCIRTLKRLGYNGTYTIEMWTEKSADPIGQVKQAKTLFDQIFDRLDIRLEGNKNA